MKKFSGKNFPWEENGRMEKVFKSLEKFREWIKVFSRRKKLGSI